MALTDKLTADLLKDIAKAFDDFKPRQSLLMSAGYKSAVTEKATTNRPIYDDPLLAGYTQAYMGLPVETFDIPPEEVIDWSGCRSPSRAKRRHARGIPQRVKIEYRERAYLINRGAVRQFGRDIDARMIAAIYSVGG